MYDQVCYERPFLKEVIARIDFLVPLASVAKELPPKMANAVSKLFPISQPNKAIAQELQLTKEMLQHSRKEVMEWIFFGKDREKRLVVTAEALFVSYSSYTTYEDLNRDFTIATEEIFKAFPDVRARRLGLRYVNNIEVADAADKPTSWDAYINTQLLGLFNLFGDPNHVARLFHIVELKYDDASLKFQFGMPNPDFPATIRKPLFVIDLDASVVGSQDCAEILSNVDHCHALVQDRFEHSITDKLRDRMHARPNPAH